MDRPAVATRRAATLVAAVLLALAATAPAQLLRFPGEPSCVSAEMLAAPEAALAFAGAGALDPDVPAHAASSHGLDRHAVPGWQRWWDLHAWPRLSRRRAAPVPVTAALGAKLRRVLRDALREGVGQERCAAALALARLDRGSALIDLVVALRRGSPEVQPSVALALGVLGREGARPYLVALVNDTPFGRGALGRFDAVVPDDVRAAATLALGMLPPERDGDMLRDMVLAPAKYTPAVHVAACAALGLRDAAHAPEPVSSTESVYGPARLVKRGIRRDAAKLLELVESAYVDSTSRAVLLVSLSAGLPRDARIHDVAVKWLESDDAVLVRHAVSALSRCDLDAKARRLLWERVRDRRDTHASGLALITLARAADDATFEKLIGSLALRRPLRPFAAFALVQACGDDPVRRERVSVALREWLGSDAGVDTDAGAACVALGLLGDREATGLLARLAREHDVDIVRSAAALGAGLLGGTGETPSPLPRRTTADPFVFHDRALATALSGTDSGDALCDAIHRSRDTYALAGVARALALVRDRRCLDALVTMARAEKTTALARAFCLGAIGLSVDRRADDPLARLRELMPMPTVSSAVQRALAHL